MMTLLQKISRSLPLGAVWVGLLALPLFVLISHATPVAAQPPITAKWVLDVRFENSAIVADWTGSVYRGNTLLRSWVDDVSATCVVDTPGLVTVGVDAATFAGGTIGCNLPSFKQRVFEETGGRLTITDSCQAVGPRIDVWMQATLRDPDFVAAGRILPLVNHQDFGLRMALLDGGVGDASLRLDGGAMSSESDLFALAGAGVVQQVGSRINPCNNSQCRARHQVDSALHTLDTIAMSPISGVTLPTTVTIGSDGVDYYFGDIIDLRVDPGCPATTG